MFMKLACIFNLMNYLFLEFSIQYFNTGADDEYLKL